MSGSIQSLENVGMEQVGETEAEGEWVDRVVGLKNVRCQPSGSAEPAEA